MGTALSSDISKYQHVNDSITLHLGGFFNNFLLRAAFELKKTKREKKKKSYFQKLQLYERLDQNTDTYIEAQLISASFSGQSTGDMSFTVLRSMGKNIA